MKTLDLLQREIAIETVKSIFSSKLKKEMDLIAISAPLAVIEGTGINDDLNGIERPAQFPIKALDEKKGVVVHSLAKWKRLRLHQLEIPQYKGVLTHMHALRPDEDYSVIHSIYVDQWDWEKHISKQDRSIGFLKKEVQKIYASLVETEAEIEKLYPEIKATLPQEIYFIHTQELLDKYPSLTPKEREDAIVKEKGAVFVMGIGGKLSDTSIHDGRAADYDDWSTKNEEGLYGLNGDILVWHPVLERSFELSSMGIRVDKEALEKQLKICDMEWKKDLYFHQLLLDETLPQSIGGGIGQSRVCMYMLKLSHIGQVQVGVWADEVIQSLEKQEIKLL